MTDRSRSMVRQVRLPPSVSRILFVRNLPFKVSAEEMYEVFGRYGAIRQIRLGDPENAKTKGTAFVVYEDILDAKNAVDHLSGFSIGGRYLTVLYFQPTRKDSAATIAEKQAEIERLKREHGITSDDEPVDLEESSAEGGGRRGAAAGSGPARASGRGF